MDVWLVVGVLFSLRVFIYGVVYMFWVVSDGCDRFGFMVVVSSLIY